MERLALTKAPADAGNKKAECEVELLQRLRMREGSALGELAERFGSHLARAAYLHLGDTHLAADAVQEALIAAWDGALRTGESTSLRPWLFGILFNRCRKISRAERRRRAREREAAKRKERAACLPAEEVEAAEEWLGKLRKALACLDEPFREVVILRYERGLGVGDAAAALGIPEGTVKSRTHEAIARLRTHMEE